MERVVANITGKARREKLNGREYLVAPTTLIVPGVLNGSQGKLFYPPEDVAKNPRVWNGMPLIGYHPTHNGEHVSGRDPVVLDKSWLGSFFRATANGKLAGESWFDEVLTKNFDKTLPPALQLVPRLERGDPIEVSTGLYTENEPAPPGATHNGNTYDFIARNYQPDHIAVLPDMVGACSVRDGCGVNVNEAVEADVDGWFQGMLRWLSSKGYGWTGNANPEGCNQHTGPGCAGGGGESSGGYGAPTGDPVADILKLHNDAGGGSGKVASGEDKASAKGDADKAFARLDAHKKQLESLPKAKVMEVHKAMGFHQKPANKDAAVKMIIDRIKGRMGSYDRVSLQSQESWDDLTGNAGRYGNPQSTATGLFKRHGAGTGKGEVHEAAQRGHMVLTDRDRELGADAASLLAATGHNPASWVADEGKWEKAKAAADKGGYEDDAYWAVVAHIYQQMGGEVKSTTENAEPSEGDSTVNRDQTITWLVANCDCWKDGKDTLNTLKDDQLAKLKAAAEKTGVAVAVANKAMSGVKIGEATLVFNAERGDFVVRNADGEECDPEDAECKKREKEEATENAAPKPPPKPPKPQPQPQPKPLTEKEWLETAPPAIREAVRNAMRIEADERTKLIRHLTANVADETARKNLAARLSTKPLDELRDYVNMLPPVVNREQETQTWAHQPDYFGAAGAVVDNAGEQEVLDLPVMNWDSGK